MLPVMRLKHGKGGVVAGGINDSVQIDDHRAATPVAR